MVFALTLSIGRLAFAGKGGEARHADRSISNAQKHCGAFGAGSPAMKFSRHHQTLHAMFYEAR